MVKFKKSHLFIVFLLIFTSCNKKTIKVPYVELMPKIKHLVSIYIGEVGETDLNERDIYIDFDAEYKTLSIRNDFSSPCFTDIKFDYFAKYNNYNFW